MMMMFKMRIMSTLKNLIAHLKPLESSAFSSQTVIASSTTFITININISNTNQHK